MKSKLTKILCLVMGAILLVTGTVAVTLAYLQDISGTVTNTMTVGKIDIELDESKVNENGETTSGRTKEGNAYKLIPSKNYTKDPRITVKAGSESCYVFLGVFINGNLSSVLDTSEGKGIEAQLAAAGWQKLMTGTNNTKQMTWTDAEDSNTQYQIYYKPDAIKASNTDTPITTFTSFTVAASATDISKADKTAIKVKAFAIQSANLNSAPEAWTAAGFSNAGT